MSQNKLRLLLGNPAGLDALLEYLSQEIDEIEEALNKAARSALFKAEDRDCALAIHGKLNAYRDLQNVLTKLGKTSTEGK